MNKIKDIVYRYGIKGVLLNIISKILKILHVTLEFKSCYAFDISEVSPNISSECRRLSYQDFLNKSEEDFEWLTEQKMRDLRQSFETSEFIAIGIFIDNSLASYGCVSTAKLGDIAELKCTDGYLYDDYTFPQYRGRGLHKQLIMERIRELKNMGKTRALSIVADYNRASYTSYLKCGFYCLESFIQYKFGTGTTKNTFQYEKKDLS